MTDRLPLLLPYLPPPLLRSVQANPGRPPHCSAQRFAAALLFADVSGFTPLTEALGRHGSAGAEELNRLMNSYFDRMISLLTAEGGEVVSFSGDAISVLFPALDEPPGHAVRRAYQAGTAMQAAMAAFHTLPTSVGPVTLGMKVSIGAGEVVALQVGGIFDRWEYVIAGEPLQQIAAAEPQMTRGAVLLSPEAQALLYPEPLPARARGPLLPADTPEPDALAEVLRCYVSRAVETALRAGKHAWLSELRPMSVLFIGADGMDYTQDAGGQHLHHLVRTAQSAIYRYEGSLIQVVVDDKGTVILALFGAPPLAHEDDALRAVRSALDLQAHYHGDAPHADGIELKLGIATGRVFVGLVGSDIRRTYAAMGDTVNLAARLMGRAAVGEVLCDFATYRQAREQITFAALPPVRLKGKASLVRIYRPGSALTNEAADSPLPDMLKPPTDLPFVGRQTEVAHLEATMAALQAGHGNVLIIQGEAGIGKSRLVRELIRRVRERGWTGLLGVGQSIEQQTPYHAWRDMFNAFFELEAGTPHATRQTRVQTLVAEIAPDQRERLPLLNDLLNLDLPDTPLTAELDPALRRQNLGLLLLSLLHGWARDSQLILVLEDAHWLDSLSWEFLLQVARSLAVVDVPIWLVLSMRPAEAHTPVAAYAATLQALPQATTLALARLDSGDILQLVTARLGLAPGALPDAVTDLIDQYADGNPFFAEELVLTLRDQGHISIEPDPVEPHVRHCRVTGDIHRMHATLPTTVHGLILARLDRLVQDAQLILKVAAVIGRIFGHALLTHTLQRHTPVTEEIVPQHLQKLDALDITMAYRQDPMPMHMFRHVIIQEVTYQTLLFAQRRLLHRTIAEWHEVTYGGTDFSILHFALTEPTMRPTALSPFYTLLAYHYRHAENTVKERQYAWLAGEQAAVQYANTEALQYLTRALELTDAHTHAERYALLLAREQVYDRQGNRAAQLDDLAALAHLAEQTDTLAWQAETAIRQANYDIVTGDYPAAIAATQRTVDRIEQTAAPEQNTLLPLLVRAYLQGGRALRFQADYPAAQQQLTQALHLAQAHTLLELEAEALRQLGAVTFFQDDYAAARTYDEQALQLFQQLQNRQQEAHTLNSLGSDASEQGDYTGAMRYYEAALALFQTVGDQWGMGTTLGNLGQVCREQGDYTRAIHAYQRGLDLARATGDAGTEGWLLGNSGWVLLDCGEYGEAMQMFAQALRVCRTIGARVEEGWVLSGLGLVCHLQGDQTTAQTHEYQVLALAEASNNRSLAGDAWLCLGHTLAAEGKLAEAHQAYTTSLAVWYEVGQSNRAMEAHAGLARVALLQDDHATARAHVEPILAYLDQHALAGTDEPFRIYLTCYQVLQAGHDPRAGQILRTACARLRERADHITDEGLRRSYLEYVAAHRALLLAEAEGRNP